MIGLIPPLLHFNLQKNKRVPAALIVLEHLYILGFAEHCMQLVGIAEVTSLAQWGLIQISGHSVPLRHLL